MGGLDSMRKVKLSGKIQKQGNGNSKERYHHTYNRNLSRNHPHDDKARLPLHIRLGRKVRKYSFYSSFDSS